MLGEYAHESGRETAELVLLDELVQIDTEKFKDEAQMLSVNKGIFKSEEVVVVVLVELRIQLQ